MDDGGTSLWGKGGVQTGGQGGQFKAPPPGEILGFSKIIKIYNIFVAPMFNIFSALSPNNLNSDPSYPFFSKPRMRTAKKKCDGGGYFPENK